MILRARLVRAGTARSLLAAIGLAGLSYGKVFDTEDILAAKALQKASAAARAGAIEGLASRLHAGDVVLLPRQFDLGDVDLSRYPDGISLLYGRGGRIFMGGARHGLTFANSEVQLIPQSRASYLAKGSARSAAAISGSNFFNVGSLQNADQDDVHYVIVWMSSLGNSTLSNVNFRNSSVLYFRYDVPGSGSKGRGPYLNLNNVDATNSTIFGIVETNYCDSTPGVRFDHVKGLFYGNSDTERGNAPLGLYQLNACDHVTLVNARNFHPHSACATTRGMGYNVQGGNNVAFLGHVDIGDNAAYSLYVTDSKDLGIFGGFFEDQVLFGGDNGNPVKFFYTPKGFGSAGPQCWGAATCKAPEPPHVDGEQVFAYQGVAIDSSTRTAPSVDGLQVPRPPRVPSMRLASFEIPAGAAKVSASWGKDVVALGADVSGKAASDAAVSAALANADFVELPAGTLRFDHPVPIPCRADGRTIRIVGAGQKATKIKTSGNFPSFQWRECPEPLAKAGAAAQAGNAVEIHEVAFDGGGTKPFEWQFKGDYRAQLNNHITFQNYTSAAVIIGDSVGNIKYRHPTGENDQVRWTFCDFINTGDYGIWNSFGMVDKQLFFKCNFSGQRKGGLFIPRSHMFEASSIANCTFKDIGGPAIKLGGNNTDMPGPFMLMDNLIQECGNENEAAVDLGYAKEVLVVGNRIEIKTKPWKYGYLGTATVMQHDTVDVNLANARPDAAGFGIRHPRRAFPGRLGGNVMTDLVSNASLAFIDDMAAWQASLGDNLEQRPGWVDYPYGYSHLLDSCSFEGGKRFYDYVLVTTNKDASFKSQLALQGVLPPPLRSRPAPLAGEGSGPVDLFDMKGRRIARLPEGKAVGQRALALKPGMYYLKDKDGIKKFLAP